MAQWVSHCIVADRVLARLPRLDRHAFCVGNLAPDCNLPNEDWSSFTPSREITHRMRARAVPALREKAEGLAETWDDFKKLISVQERLKDVHCVEREYLDAHPDSCYFTELRDLERFPDYIDLLPPGAIPKKGRMMLYLPAREAGSFPFVAFSREEYAAFLDRAAALSSRAIEEARRAVEEELRRK
ncbi:MAG: hypothetical protein IKH34_04420 [Oscillospiraceae bacterium]|nr:hypothetical protein [Oscillospiraceae bacterium]